MEILKGPHQTESVLIADSQGHELMLLAYPPQSDGREGFVALNTREEPVYLSRNGVAELVLALTRWVETGKISGEE